ncbi:hypothetical protein [Merismopedia glauca]|uniref:Cell division protein FtsL n=1 Tax=Merismopedia glauca CCAP 1448/3 TaxID=1296344 RepID=A0A2T1C2S7_9CYAN|nr:hypothetical protein [Merismopedia glauca]PSB02569.1 hypothetical protein C7B64_12635 [Merismopedia glauca CCAP 1448/3]
MSFATQSTTNRGRQSKKHLTVAPQVTRNYPESVSPVPDLKPTPLALPWLRSLLVAQRSTTAICFLLVAGLLSVYTWTVYTQQLWTREYRKLESLQRQERQMTAANEVLKNSLADTAERPESGLLPTSVANSIFVIPAPQRRFIPAKAVEAPEPKRPLGY